MDRATRITAFVLIAAWSLIPIGILLKSIDEFADISGWPAIAARVVELKSASPGRTARQLYCRVLSYVVEGKEYRLQESNCFWARNGPSEWQKESNLGKIVVINYRPAEPQIAVLDGTTVPVRNIVAAVILLAATAFFAFRLDYFVG